MPIQTRHGWPLRAEAERPSPPQEPEPAHTLAGEPEAAGRGLWPWLVALVVLVLVLAGGGAIYVSARNHRAGPRDLTETRTVVQPTASVQPPASTPTRTSHSAAAIRVAVPGVVGLHVRAALASVRRVGLVARTRRTASSAGRGQVVAQNPPAGKRLAKGAAVVVVVAKGPATARGKEPVGPSKGQSAPATTAAEQKASRQSLTVPDLGGKTLADARAALRRTGLVTEVRRVPSSLPAGTVVAQSPTSGATAMRGDHVFVTVSLGRSHPAGQSTATGQSTTTGTGQQSVAVPSVVGEDEAMATADLQSAGLEVRVVDQATTDPSQDGVVVDQSPAAAQQAAQNEAVTIVVGRYANG
jgi:beta-lactam-binding protein with PASTA domain